MTESHDTTPGTKTELAQRLGVTVKRITSAIERGDITAERIGVNDRGHRYVVDMDGAEPDFRTHRERTVEKAKVRIRPSTLPDLSSRGYAPRSREPTATAERRPAAH
jgi:hypothetical protein